MENDRPLVGIVVDGAMGFGRGILRGVMQYANTRRRWLLHKEMRAIGRPLVAWPDCDGAVLAASAPNLVKQVVGHTRHVVSCSGSTDPADMPVVCTDDVAIGQMAAMHLMNCRLENFGFYGRHDFLVSNNRAKGFTEALSERHFECERSPVDIPAHYRWTSRPHWARLIQWLEKLPKPVGIFALDDVTADDLAAACLAGGLSVPDRVAIIGVNNDDLLCESAWPPLSSVETQPIRLGYAAAGLLDLMMSGKRLPARRRMTRLAPIGVVRRASTDVLAVDDPNLADAVRFIREHACDPCTVSDVLAQVPVGRRWMEKQFVAKIGRSPHDEIVRVRMETARRLLLHTTSTLPEVAEQCGFEHVQSFNRLFRQSVGDSPAAFRRTQRARPR